MIMAIQSWSNQKRNLVPGGPSLSMDFCGWLQVRSQIEGHLKRHFFRSRSKFLIQPFREAEEKVEEKPDMTDFETFSQNFDKIEKQHRKAGKAMVKGGKGGRKSRRDDSDDEIDSDDEYVKFMKMKQKMIAKGKISESEESDGGDDEFAEFMRWKQQKRRAARRGLDDWDQDCWIKLLHENIKFQFSNTRFLRYKT